MYNKLFRPFYRERVGPEKLAFSIQCDELAPKFPPERRSTFGLRATWTLQDRSCLGAWWSYGYGCFVNDT